MEIKMPQVAKAILRKITMLEVTQNLTLNHTTDPKKSQMSYSITFLIVYCL
jgi:hypothetical protein